MVSCKCQPQGHFVSPEPPKLEQVPTTGAIQPQIDGLPSSLPCQPDCETPALRAAGRTRVSPTGFAAQVAHAVSGCTWAGLAQPGSINTPQASTRLQCPHYLGSFALASIRTTIYKSCTGSSPTYASLSRPAITVKSAFACRASYQSCKVVHK